MINSVKHKRNLIQSIVKGKNIVLIGNSPTVSTLVENREFFRGKNFVYGSLNHWVPIERDFLKPIKQEFQLLCVANSRSLDRHRKDIRKFTYRKVSALMVADTLDVKDFRGKYLIDFCPAEITKKPRVRGSPRFGNRKTWVSTYPSTEALRLPALHSILVMTAAVAMGHPRSIFVFGCDGGTTRDFTAKNRTQCHYGCDSHCTNRRRVYKKYIERENSIYKGLMKHMAKTFDFVVPPIYIAGAHSRYKFGLKRGMQSILKVMKKYNEQT